MQSTDIRPSVDTSFTPVSVTPIPENASQLRLLRTLMTSPVASFPPNLYESRYHVGHFLKTRMVHVADPDMIEKILRSEIDRFPKSDFQQLVLERSTGTSLLTAVGDTWKRHRKALASIFTPVHTTSFLPIFLSEAQKAVTAIETHSTSLDVTQLTTGMTLNILGRTLLRMDEVSATSGVARDVQTLLSTLGRIDPLDFFEATRSWPKPWARKGKQAVRSLQKLATEQIHQRQSVASHSDKADLVDLLLSAEAKTGSALTEEEIRDNIITFIGAGHETTSLALAWSIYLLSNSQQWQLLLRQELQQVCGEGELQPEHIPQLHLHRQVIKETLRLYPSAPAIDRLAMEDIELCGFQFRKHDYVVIAIYPTHRNALLWQNPNLFDPSRFSDENTRSHHRFQYLPFGSGPRVCVGAEFAMSELTVILATLIKSFEFSTVPGFKPEPRSRITLFSDNGIKVRFSRRG